MNHATPHAPDFSGLGDLVHLPYRRDGQTLDGINCWALVRLACQRVHGTAPPLLASAAAPVSPVVRGAVRQGWRRVHGAPEPGDILVMRTAWQSRHTGLVLRVRHCLQMLHATEGGSVVQPLADLPVLGFHHIRAWRLSTEGTAP